MKIKKTAHYRFADIIYGEADSNETRFGQRKNAACMCLMIYR